MHKEIDVEDIIQQKNKTFETLLRVRLNKSKLLAEEEEKKEKYQKRLLAKGMQRDQNKKVCYEF